MKAKADGQEEILAFLGNPATYRGQKVKRIDTHAASVFLAGDGAIKIKRSVRFPFLDYSTPARRKQACMAELAVNMPFAPEIYLDVKPVTREADGSLAIDGAGTPADWVVMMRRFDENRTLDRLAGEIDEALAAALGVAVAAAHAKAPAVDAEAWIAALGSYIDEHVEAFQEQPELFSATDINALAHASRAAYARIVPLLRERGRLGFVRRIHGDLHLGNIALMEGKPVLFDAIEFSEIIATGDVFYDLGFLLMDLVERHLTPAANVVLNRYLAETRHVEDLDALAMLPFFLSMRAAIRAKVTAARMARAKAAERGSIAQSARAYFALARHAIRPAGAKFIAVGGLSGTGKTRLALALAPLIAPMPGAVILRSDLERKARFGRRATEKLSAGAYRAEITAGVYATLADKARRILAAGHSAIVDAVFAQPQERAAIAEIGRSANIPLQGLFLTADLNSRLTRVGSRVADASDADKEVARAQERYDLGALDWTTIDASGTFEETLTRATATLARAI